MAQIYTTDFFNSNCQKARKEILTNEPELVVRFRWSALTAIVIQRLRR